MAPQTNLIVTGVQTRSAAQRIRRFVFNNAPLLTTITIFIVAYFVAGLIYPAMQKPQVFFNLFINNAALLIVSIGMTLVIITGGIDLSVGGVVALVSVASAVLLRNGASPFVVMPLMIVIGTLFGLAIGSIIHFLKVQPFIVTLMGMYFARGLAYIISLEAVPIENAAYKSLALTPINLPTVPNSYVYIYAFIGPILLLVAIYLSFFTRFGRTIYAIGNNEQSARLMGLPAGRTKIAVYAFSGFCSSLAGIVWSIALLSGYGQYAPGMELDAIAAVVIGGTMLTGGAGNVIGTAFGVLITGTIISILQFNGTLSSWWTRIVVGVLTLIFIGVQSVLYRRGKRS
ncbi:MAG TPA: sugar ABC transporter permease YjfF [Anaerolineae bacterium]|nr:sugar ABC transporter permease YjfF [Anaerolineae bacterium]